MGVLHLRGGYVTTCMCKMRSYNFWQGRIRTKMCNITVLCRLQHTQTHGCMSLDNSLDADGYADGGNSTTQQIYWCSTWKIVNKTIKSMI